MIRAASFAGLQFSTPLAGLPGLLLRLAR